MELRWALLVEKRARDMEPCQVERIALAPQPEGRRAPPGYGYCAQCGWTHALPAAGEGGAE